MKRKILLKASSLLLSIALVLSSCSKNDNPAPLSSYNMSANANGQFLTFEAKTYLNTFPDSTIDIDGSWLTTIGDWPSTTKETFNLNFLGLKFLKGYVGTYNLLTAITNNCNYNAVPANGNGNIFFYNANSTNPGTLSITMYDSINKTISGTFTFNGISVQNGSITLSNGVFTKIKL